MSATIRLATETDAAAILEIYAPFCADTPVSFETEPPSELEIRNRINKTLDVLPWLVCEDEHQLLGYAYTSRHRERAGYRWSVDVSVYVREGRRGSGIGRALYTSLFAIIRLQGFFNILAGITLPNPGSVALHEKMGLRPVARLSGHRLQVRRLARRRLVAALLGPPADEPMEPIDFPSIQSRPEFSAAIAAGLNFLKSSSSG